MTKHWVNIFLSPYDKKRFYISMTHPTQEAAITALGKGRKGNKNQTYIGTVDINIPDHEK